LKRLAAALAVVAGVMAFGAVLRAVVPEAGPGLWLFDQAILAGPRLAGAAVLWLLLRRRPPQPPWKLPRPLWAVGGALVVAGWLVFDGSSAYTIRWTAPEAAFGALVAASVAVFDELAFRGVILSALAERWPAWPASLAASALYVLYYWKSKPQWPMLFLSGLLLSLLRLGGAPLALLMLIHFSADVGWYQLGRGAADPSAPLGLAGLGLVAAGILLCRLEVERSPVS
jgi:membrane protease YdiL (CAAX protease family)